MWGHVVVETGHVPGGRWLFWQWGLRLRPSVGDVRVDDMLQGRRGRAVLSKIVWNPTLPVDPLQPGSWWPGVTEQP